MSAKVFVWAREIVVSGGFSAKAVLLLMADYAGGEDGSLFTSQGRIARELQTTPRTVQRAIESLIEDGIVEKEAREAANGRKTSNLYRIIGPEYSEGKRGTRHTVTPDTVSHTPPDTVSRTPPTQCQGLPDTVSGSIEGTSINNLSCSYEHSTGGRDVVSPSIEIFEAILIEWASSGEPNSRTKPDEARDAWIEAVDAGVDPDVLASAARRALAEDADFKRRGAPGLQRWLGDLQYQAWIVRAETAPVVTVARFADEAIRAKVAAWCGPDFVASYLDPAAWDGERKVITTRTGFAADKLNREVKRQLVGLVSIIEPAGKT